MKHLGDITKLHGGQIPPVDIITFGSPCTRLSVAGRHDGFDVAFSCFGDDEEKPHYALTIKAHDKYQYLYEDVCPICGKVLTATNESALFFHAVRIIEEMREATNGAYPAFAVWENVPGAFSSNKGEDFRQVLEELCRVKRDVHIPKPRRGKWDHSGSIVGDGISICWRVLDAQYWGVPQRRKRIFLVADFRDRPTREILFVPKGVFGYPAPREEAREEAAADAGSCADQAVGFDGYNQQLTGHIAQTIRANKSDSDHVGIVLLSTTCIPDVARTLTARHDGSPCIDRGGNFVAVFENHAQDSRITECRNVAPTVSRKFGTGGNNTPLVMAHGQANAEILRDCCPTLNCNHEQPIVASEGYRNIEVYGICSDKSNSMLSSNPNSGIYKANTARTLDQNGGNPSCNQGGMLVVGVDCRNMDETEGVYPTLQAKNQGGYSLNYSHAARILDTVRRLTPLECERLQGYPDGWTDLPGASDSARYKALGNSLAIPCARYVLGAVRYASGRDDLTLGSLFDGIGGFPLAGIFWGIVPVWASEIEKFPIEVTKLRFGED